MTYTMNSIGLIVFILIIVGGTVSLGFDVFQGPKRSPAAIVFFFTVLVMGLGDFYFVEFGGVGTSLSAWIVSHGAGVVGFWKFAVGCVCGHLFFPMQQISSTAPTIEKK